jgi:hypothetical protein
MYEERREKCHTLGRSIARKTESDTFVVSYRSRID